MVGFAGCSAERPENPRPQPAPTTNPPTTDPGPEPPSDALTPGQDPAPEPAPPRTSDQPGPFSNPNGAISYLSGVALLARDPVTGDLGVACLSTVPAIGAYAFDARADAGVVVTLGRFEPALRSDCLDRMGRGESGEAVARSHRDDAQLAGSTRVVAVLDRSGTGGAMLGSGALPRFGSHTGEGHVALTVQCHARELELAVSEAWLASAGLPFPERLLVALEPALETGKLNGPARSFALLVVRRHGGIDGTTDRMIDVRADYVRDPIDTGKFLLKNAYLAYVGPRLREMQRGISDPSNPVFQANLEWLQRIRQGHEIGVRK